jgi:hypothetical protein
MDRCPELLFGAASYFAALAILVGALVRIGKRIPWLPADAVPAVAFALGYVADIVVGLSLCERPLSASTAVTALAGGLAGLAAAGGPEALTRSARLVGLDASRLLGAASDEQAKRAGGES